MASIRALVEEQFAACTHGIEADIYQGVKVAFFAVVDNLDAGREWASFFPGQYNQAGRPLRGRDAWMNAPLPAFATFIYPELDLTERQRLAFVDTLFKKHPEVRELVIVTSVASICTDATPEVLRSLRFGPPAWDDDA